MLFIFLKFFCEPGEIRGPSAVALNQQGHILVSDRMNHRIQAFSREGRFLYSVGSEGKEDGMKRKREKNSLEASNFSVI